MSPAQAPLGVLLLHGLTSSLDCVNGLVPFLQNDGVPYRMPVLRGHGTRYQDLRGVRWTDWYADAAAALDDLLAEAEQAVVVGLSMGTLLTLRLAIQRPQRLAGIVLVATALHINNPLAYGGPLGGLAMALAPLLSRLAPYQDMIPARAEPALLAYNSNYAKVATDAASSMFKLASIVEPRLSEVRLPLLIIHSRADTTAKPDSAQIIYDRVSSPHKKLIWFTRSEHEMMMDVERQAVFETIMEFVLFHRVAPVPSPLPPPASDLPYGVG